MNIRRAFLAGVVGGAIMAVLGKVVPVSVEMILGTLFLPRGVGAWVLGLVLHLVISGAIALLYGLGFERITHRATAGIGAAFSIVHVVIGGLALAALPAIHPLIPEQIRAPGMFMSSIGFGGVLLFLIEHLVYGAIVGQLYGPVMHPRETGAPVTRFGRGRVSGAA
ncbi:hypothetical protein [Sandaracinus amylolyticus]|uniref:hypothetical protein n=1 Tax=Sandaracinus amylolyticus TaxID=927083 RepID=UPI001F1D9279|nr:hypothetical protein [Sandaracinus amylolyticus]UJR85514.1 Hypothetical protein I5071_75940 [Sandaracinus amylolyticus]